VLLNEVCCILTRIFNIKSIGFTVSPIKYGDQGVLSVGLSIIPVGSGRTIGVGRGVRNDAPLIVVVVTVDHVGISDQPFLHVASGEQILQVGSRSIEKVGAERSGGLKLVGGDAVLVEPSQVIGRSIPRRTLCNVTNQRPVGTHGAAEVPGALHVRGR
jgi:hypothetical protein